MSDARRPPASPPRPGPGGNAQSAQVTTSSGLTGLTGLTGSAGSIGSAALRVVVADDQAVFRDIAADVIAAAPGVELAAVTDRVRTLPTLVADADALLLDVRMPGEDPLEMACALRRERPALRIVLVSAESVEDIPDDVFDAGVGFLAKEDLTPETLRAALGVGHVPGPDDDPAGSGPG